MKPLTFCLALASTLILSSNGTAATSLLHKFGEIADDGAYCYGSLTLDGSTLYGMTGGGGVDWRGTVFSIDTSGTHYDILHSFEFSEGENPHGNLTVSGPLLYGLTESGGAHDYGTLFSFNTDTDELTVLHHFGDPSIGDDGERPSGSLILSGSTLYGMTPEGGSERLGTVFSFNTVSSEWNVLHHFGDGTVEDDGEYAPGSLILSGSTLYGMTTEGGSGGLGTIFSLDTESNELTILHHFGDGEVDDDGEYPLGSLILSGSTLYGMTLEGGAHGDGIVFSLDTNTNDLTVLHHFDGDSGDGRYPQGSLILSGSKLCGMTEHGGGDNGGVVFSLTTDGGLYDVLHEFAGAPDDGAQPWGDLTLAGSALYGMTTQGGLYYGTIFSLPVSGPPVDVPEPSTMAMLLGLAGAGLLGYLRRRRRS